MSTPSEILKWIKKLPSIDIKYIRDKCNYIIDKELNYIIENIIEKELRYPHDLGCEQTYDVTNGTTHFIINVYHNRHSAKITLFNKEESSIIKNSGHVEIVRDCYSCDMMDTIYEFFQDKYSELCNYSFYL